MKSLKTIFLLLSFLSVFVSQFNIPVNSIDSHISKLNSPNAIEVYKTIEQLKSYNYFEFTTEHKSKLQAFLLEDTPHVDKLTELCGFLKMEEELRAFAQNKRISKQVKETINYALIRAGDDSKLKLMLKNLKKLEMSDDYANNLVPVLVYTRRKEVFNHLLSQIQEKGKPCNHPDLDTPGKFSCAYPIIERIAPYIKDFPVEVNQFGIVSSNPDKMLVEVRQWIVENKDSYELITEKY
jgi:hypothetical protein